MSWECTECGASYNKWEGKCRFCGGWDTIRESAPAVTAVKGHKKKKEHGIAVRAEKADGISCEPGDRLSTASAELNSVFGGGLVRGSVYLISGEPGVGKSTLLLMLSSGLDKKILYISGEETCAQIKQRMERLSVKGDNIYLSSETETVSLAEHILAEDYKLVFVDSIQTVYNRSFDNLPGSVIQIKNAAYSLIEACKSKGCILILTGHINKSGDIAGPKLLEHIVDGTVLMYSEPQREMTYDLRVLKPLKNRFGSVDTTGIFYMTSSGLTPVSREVLTRRNKEFFAGREQVSGTVFYPHFIGKRLFFSEIEALVASTGMNYPRRSAEGISVNRLNRIIAILEKFSGIDLSGFDVYVNVSGGIRSEDIYMDLSFAAAVYSSFRGIALPPSQLFLGEVGLNGLVRPVRDLDSRREEISRYGDFSLCLNSKKDGVSNIKDIASLVAVVNNKSANQAAVE